MYNTLFQAVLLMLCVQMYTDNIARLSFGGALIPFHVSVCWVGDGGGAQTRLTHKVLLLGTKQPSNYLTVTPPRQCTGTILYEIHEYMHFFKQCCSLLCTILCTIIRKNVASVNHKFCAHNHL